jgi:hypothetical protein
MCTRGSPSGGDPRRALLTDGSHDGGDARGGATRPLLRPDGIQLGVLMGAGSTGRVYVGAFVCAHEPTKGAALRRFNGAELAQGQV